MVNSRELTYHEAISEGLVQSMEADPSIFVTGIGVADHIGIFGTTRQASIQFGEQRVFDSPNCENALTGIAIGAASVGKRPVLVHARNDFMFLALDQMINVAAKWSYMYGGRAGTVPIVVRGIIGKGWGQGATHSQSIQSVIAHFPGIQVVMPATPADAKGLTISALRGDKPVVILEHRSLYNVVGRVPEEPVPVPIGSAAIARRGSDVTIAASSVMVRLALQASEALVPHGIDVEVVDLRSLRPFDRETVVSSIRHTGRLVVADTSWTSYGLAAEVAAVAVEDAFDSLKAAVIRIGLADCPAPVSKSLEDVFYPSALDLARACLTVCGEADRPMEIADEVGVPFMGPY
jgi:pyruvate/2-oxoglutarate/acetoin dehydrogenase E1 component